MRHVLEYPALIAIQEILSVVSDVDVFPAIVVVVAYANSLAPTGGGETCFHSHIGESPVVIIAVEMICRALTGREAFQGCAIDDKKIEPPIIVVVEDCDASPRCFDDVLLGVGPTEHIHHGEA